MKIEGVKGVIDALKRKGEQWEKRASVIVGYKASYAIYVHENLEAHHKVGQAKYLEQPARELSGNGTLGKLVVDKLKSGATLGQALKVAGLRIQRESQKIVPVEFGILKNSAFTVEE